jgi:hypothetical protein
MAMKPKKTKKPVEMELETQIKNSKIRERDLWDTDMGGEIMVEDSKMMKKKTKRMRGGGMVQKMRMGGKVGKSCAVRGA